MAEQEERRHRMKGRRIPDNEWFEWDDRGELRPGDYGRIDFGDDPRDARWLNVTPDGEMGRLKYEGEDGPGTPFHQVIEHEDGTITVCPSIQGRVIDSANVHGAGPITTQAGWHGWLERGVWRTA